MSEVEKLKALLTDARQQMVAVHHKYACAMCSEDESEPNCPCGMQELAKVVDRINAALESDEDDDDE